MQLLSCGTFDFRPLCPPLAVLLAAMLGACATQAPPYAIDKSVRTSNQDSRIQFLVMHYTASHLEKSLKVLTVPQSGVSAHYLVPDEPDATGLFRVHQLADENKRTWHAGVSAWRGSRLLNPGSLGIEAVNLGYAAGDGSLPLMQRRWYSFPQAQTHVIGQLARDIIERHNIKPDNVVGHADVAPGRKVDPGPLFPWRELFTHYQVGAWPDSDRVDFYQHNFPFTLAIDSTEQKEAIAALQEKLLHYGYDTPQNGVLDKQTTDVIAAFQMHFRPRLYDGTPDTETVAILDALLEKYRQ